MSSVASANDEAPVESKANADLQLRLRKIEGQVRGIQRMLAEGQPCQDVLTQLMAVRSGIDQVALKILDSQICKCVGEASATESVDLATLQQTLKIWAKFS